MLPIYFFFFFFDSFLIKTVKKTLPVCCSYMTFSVDLMFTLLHVFEFEAVYVFI